MKVVPFTTGLAVRLSAPGGGIYRRERSRARVRGTRGGPGTSGKRETAADVNSNFSHRFVAARGIGVEGSNSFVILWQLPEAIRPHRSGHTVRTVATDEQGDVAEKGRESGLSFESLGRA